VLISPSLQNNYTKVKTQTSQRINSRGCGGGWGNKEKPLKSIQLEFHNEYIPGDVEGVGGIKKSH